MILNIAGFYIPVENILFWQIVGEDKDRRFICILKETGFRFDSMLKEEEEVVFLEHGYFVEQ